MAPNAVFAAGNLRLPYRDDPLDLVHDPGARGESLGPVDGGAGDRDGVPDFGLGAAFDDESRPVEGNDRPHLPHDPGEATERLLQSAPRKTNDVGVDEDIEQEGANVFERLRPAEVEEEDADTLIG